MSTKSAPAVHSVHFYDGEHALISRLRGVVATGLEMGNSVLIVATEGHRRELSRALAKRGVDVPSYEKKGMFIACDARETLASFMVNDRPDRARFLASVGGLLAEAKRAARSSGQGLTVFGEMVAVLWEEGNRIGALELEAYWNDLLNDRAFHLHCAYPRAGFAANDSEGMLAICQAHSHVIGESKPLVH
jgi:hypothetical protein